MSVSSAFSKGIPSPLGRSQESWGLSQMAGRLVELSGERASANLTVAFGLVLECQSRNEPVAWVTLRHSTFFPPDAAESGVALAQLAVVQVAEPNRAARAVVELTRSGGFDLVVLDLGPEAVLERLAREARSSRPPSSPFARRSRTTSPRRGLSTPLLTKLVGLARKNDTAVVILTEKAERTSSLSSLVSLRAETRRDPAEPCRLEVEVLKDKRRGPGRRHHEVCRAPAGLR